MPPAKRLIRPARSISLWLTISASEGASLSVEMKYFEVRMADGKRERKASILQDCTGEAKPFRFRENLGAMGRCRGFAFPRWLKCGRIEPIDKFSRFNMLDREGYRPNVGIILCNAKNEVFWGKRIREHSWQFPQGGIKRGETPEQAMFRELQEEIGLLPEHVCILGRTKDWLRYDVPTHWIKREWRGSYKGQKQIWFLLRLMGRDTDISLRASDHPEFDAWRWTHYWVSLDAVIEFKRGVYELALNELARFLDADHRKARRGLARPKPDADDLPAADADEAV